MKLNEKAFENMKKGKKQIEFRLLDEKRKKLEIGDSIEFRKLRDLTEKITVEVIGLLYYTNFYQLLSDVSENVLAYSQETIEEMVHKMHQYYSEEQERAKGVLGIRIKVLERG